MSKPKRHYADMGAPIKWNEEKIKELADELIEWSKTDEALCYGDFFLEKDLHPKLGSELASCSDNFRLVSDQAKLRIGYRRERGALKRDFDSATVARVSRLYDPEYDAFCKQQLKDEYNIKIEAVKAELEAKKIELEETKIIVNRLLQK